MFLFSSQILVVLAVASAIVFGVFTPVLMLVVGGAVAWPVAGVSAASFGFSAFGLMREYY